MPQVPIADLIVAPGNPRRSDLPRVQASLEAFGQFKPLVVTAGMRVIAGRAVLAAAKALGWSHVSVHIVEVDDETARRIELADNRSSDDATYDDAELVALLESLPSLDGTGFAPADLAELQALIADEPVALTDPDAVPDLRPDPVARIGDVFLLGPHRLMCGDATDADHVATLIAGSTVDGVWTDPPYGVAYEGGTAEKLTIINDDLQEDALRALLDDAFRHLRNVLRPGASFYVCSPSGPLETTFRLALAAAGLALRQQLVWVKDRFVLGRSDYQNRHESILTGEADAGLDHSTLLYGWRKGTAHSWYSDRTQSTVWEFPRPIASVLHPTMKPVPLVRYAVENSSRPGATWLDLFAGSGSLLIACHAAGRISYSMELDPRYADVILRRWFDHTGIAPVLASTGAEVDLGVSP